MCCFSANFLLLLQRELIFHFTLSQSVKRLVCIFRMQRFCDFRSFYSSSIFLIFSRVPTQWFLVLVLNRFFFFSEIQIWAVTVSDIQNVCF